jgi:hypothetical protein
MFHVKPSRPGVVRPSARALEIAAILRFRSPGVPRAMSEQELFLDDLS